MATWLALFALILQTLVPLGQMLQAAESDGVIYVCTPKGLVSLSAIIGQSGQMPSPQGIPQSNDSPHDDEYAACQVCTAGLFGTGLILGDQAGPLPAVDASVGSGHDLLAWRGGQPRGSLPPRGPPLSV